MHIDSFYTSSFVLPNFPLVENIPFASLCPGPDGRFGFAVCLLSPDYYANFQGSITDFPIAMLIIDGENAHVEEHHVSLSYKALYAVNLMYYAEQSTWLLAVDVVRNSEPIVEKLLDFYVVDSSTAPRWELVRSIKQKWEERVDELDGEILFVDWEPWFSRFIGHRDIFTTLIKGHVNDDGLAEHCVQLVEAQTPEHFTEYELRRGHRSISLVFDSSIMLFFCECPAEIYAWNIRMSVFDFGGKQMALKDITPVPYPARWEKWWVADDLWDWLWPTMSAIYGPCSGPELVKTCVAALQLRDQPKKVSIFKSRSRILYAKEPLPEVQGGLFWIDAMGRLLAQQECLLGESLCMCLCGDIVVGVDQMEGTWRLWSWSPVTTNTFEVQVDLQLEAKRVMLVPVESYDQYATPSFWLIAENEGGIQVSLWVGPDWRSIQQHQIEHVRLPNRRAQAQLEPEPGGIAAYQDSLLVMVIDRDYRLQLLRFR